MLISLNHLFKKIARNYYKLQKENIESAESIEEIETFLYAPVSVNLNKVISSGTSRGYKNNSHIAIQERLDELVKKNANQSEILKEIRTLISKCDPIIQPYVWRMYVEGDSSESISNQIGGSREYIRKVIKKEVDENIVPNMKKLLKLCSKNELMKSKIEKYSGFTADDIHRQYSKSIVDNIYVQID